ncbi:MAG TPA: hypothetical protein VGB45_02440 [Abditibacterium sp.]|jgi:predicted DNA-binding antitoxin AbrB/MazE fold protein
MTQIVDAIFQNGGFHLVGSLAAPLAEGQTVRLVIETEAPAKTDVLELAAGVYEGLSSSERDEIEHVALDRRDFFGADTTR